MGNELPDVPARNAQTKDERKGHRRFFYFVCKTNTYLCKWPLGRSKVQCRSRITICVIHNIRRIQTIPAVTHCAITTTTIVASAYTIGGKTHMRTTTMATEPIVMTINERLQLHYWCHHWNKRTKEIQQASGSERVRASFSIVSLIDSSMSFILAAALCPRTVKPPSLKNPVCRWRQLGAPKDGFD